MPPWKRDAGVESGLVATAGKEGWNKLREFHWRIYTTMCKKTAVQSGKRLPAMQETRVQSLGWEDPLEKKMATHSCLENPRDRGAGSNIVRGIAESSVT